MLSSLRFLYFIPIMLINNVLSFPWEKNEIFLQMMSIHKGTSVFFFFTCVARTSSQSNLVPRVLSLLRESTLVAAGHVSMHANPNRTEGGSSTKFCQHSIGRWMLGCFRDGILRRKQVICQRSYLASCFGSTWISMSMSCWLRRNFAHISLLFKITVNNQLRISLISFSHQKN